MLIGVLLAFLFSVCLFSVCLVWVGVCDKLGMMRSRSVNDSPVYVLVFGFWIVSTTRHDMIDMIMICNDMML